MTLTILQFEALAQLAAFWKLLSDRGYLMVVEELTLQTRLTDAEAMWATNEFGAKVLKPT